MLKILSLFALLFINACSSNQLTFDPQKNCSEQTLKHTTPTASEADKKYYQDKMNDIQHFFSATLTPQLQQCYQQYLDTSPNPREFAVCTETTIQNGKVTFADADDRVNLINDQLKACIESHLRSADWSFLKAKSPISLRQPIMMRAKRQ